MNKDVAIVGWAGRFPGAKNIEDFTKLLYDCKSAIDAPTEARINSTKLEPGRELRYGGFIEDIDMFDYDFFGLPYEEAKRLDPHIRLLLEVVYEAIENSQTPRKEYSSRQTAIYTNNPHLEYYKHATEYHPAFYTGNSSDFFPNWISRSFDIQGSSIAINTSCSSYLTSIHLACNDLIRNDCNVAFVCAASLDLFPYRGAYAKETECRDNNSIAFSSEANGMIYGEVAGCLILKLLDQALADGDVVHGLIKATALSNNGARSSHITAPDPSSLAAAMVDAWKRAGLRMSDVSFLEAHGSATQLGDSLEAAAFGIALAEAGERIIPVSTVKANIGHCRTGAGFPALLKALISIKHKTVFGVPGFKEASPFIDFNASHIRVCSEKVEIEGDDVYGGVTSMGAGGSNSHVVVAGYQNVGTVSTEDTSPLVVALSARSENSLRGNIKALIDSNLQQHSITDISFSLARGRTHYEVRTAFVAENHDQLRSQLASISSESIRTVNPADKVICIFQDLDKVADYNLLAQRLSSSFPTFASTMASIIGSSKDTKVKMAAYQYSFFQLANHKVFRSRSFVGHGTGKLVIAAITDESQALAHIAKSASSSAPIDGLDGKLDALAQTADAIFLAFGEGEITTRLRPLLDDPARLVVVPVVTQSCPFKELITQLYMAGLNIQWELLMPAGRKIHLPSYSFDRKRCWLGDAVAPAVKIPKQGVVRDTGLSPADKTVFQKVTGIWSKILFGVEETTIGNSDNFFELGGSSSQLVDMVSHVYEAFGVHIKIAEIFSEPTVSFLVEKLASEKRDAPIERTDVQPDGIYEMSHSQKRIWVLSQFRNGSRAYNMHASMSILGKLDLQRLEQAVQEVVDTHEILRTRFVENNNDVHQVVARPGDIELPFEIIDLPGLDRFEVTARLNDWLRKEFKLDTAPLFAIRIARIKPEEFLFLFMIHHIVSDELSLRTMMSEVLSRYESNAALRVPATGRLQYRDYVRWHKKNIDNQQSFWEERIKQFKNFSLSLPVDFKHPAHPGFDGATIEDVIEGARLDRLNAFASRRRSTTHNALFAVLHLLMSEWCNSRDVVVGTLVSGRSHVDLHSMLGVFMNFLPVTSRVDTSLSFSEFFTHFDRDLRMVYANQDYPFDLIAKEWKPGRTSSSNPVFQVLMNYHTSGMSETRSVAGLQIDFLPLAAATTTLDLRFDVYPEVGKLSLKVRYNIRKFRSTTITALVNNMNRLIDGLIAEPSKSMHDVIRDNFIMQPLTKTVV